MVVTYISRKFQSLIGILQTGLKLISLVAVKLVSIPHGYSTNQYILHKSQSKRELFQSLIGILQTVNSTPSSYIIYSVSIPHRYSTNAAKATKSFKKTDAFQSLIGILQTVEYDFHLNSKYGFQSLIGILQTTKLTFVGGSGGMVSIPHRYSTNF